MQDVQSLPLRQSSMAQDDRQEALMLCSLLLQEERFEVFWISDSPSESSVRPHDLLALKLNHAVRIVVLLDHDVDAPETRERVLAALEQGETRVYVPWPLRWRTLSNLERWGIRGVPVMGW